MQALTAAPREHLTADQVEALITGPSVTVDAGCEVLDTANAVTGNITDQLVGGTISWDNRTPVHGSCRLSLQTELAWGQVRVRPYMTLSNHAVTARFNLGVYVLTAPDTNRGEDPATFEVTGYDLLSLLQSTGPGDTWVAAAGTSYFDALQAVVDAAGVGSRLRLDGTRQATLIPATRVWALTDPPQSWLRIMIDLLTEIGYTTPWADENGALRSRPYVPLADRPVEWTLDTSDAATNLVGEDRTLSVETGDLANWWRFVRRDMTTTPVEGDGIYTVQNTGSGPTSQSALERVVRKVVWVDAADQAALVAQGDRIVAEDLAAVRTTTLEVDPLPVMGYADVFWLRDAAESEKTEAASWELNLDGSPGTLQLGGAPAPPLDVVEAQAQATVTSAAPLRVVVDGATVDSFANSLDAAAYAVGDRVTVTVRNPRPPLIQGVET